MFILSCLGVAVSLSSSGKPLCGEELENDLSAVPVVTENAKTSLHACVVKYLCSFRARGLQPPASYAPGELLKEAKLTLAGLFQGQWL